MRRDGKREFHVYEMLPASEHTGSPLEMEGESDTGVRGSRVERTHRFEGFELADSREALLERTGPTDVVYDSLVRKWFYRCLNSWAELPV